MTTSVKGGTPSNWIVCGWFTEDAVYTPLAQQLAASLDSVGAPYDLVSVPKRPGGWEVNTMAKAAQVLAAMDRHPDKTVVFMDVDYIAHGNVSALASVSGDVAFRILARRRSTGAVRVTTRSGVIVAKPTLQARRFIELWVKLSADSAWGDVDQTTLALVMGLADGCAIAPLDEATIATCLRHISASRGTTKISGMRRELMHLWRWATRAGLRGAAQAGRASGN